MKARNSGKTSLFFLLVDTLVDTRKKTLRASIVAFDCILALGETRFLGTLADTIHHFSREQRQYDGSTLINAVNGIFLTITEYNLLH